jgi:acyl-CoA reductase-like NAD-dependent aldehyde dehydrogenase
MSDDDATRNELDDEAEAGISGADDGDDESPDDGSPDDEGTAMDSSTEPTDSDDQPADDESQAGADPRFANNSPLDGEPLDPVSATPLDAIAEMVAVARAAQADWADTPLAERVEALLPVKQRLLARAEEIAQLLHREVGKPLEEAVLAEVLPNADLVDYWSDNIEELLDGSDVELDPLSYPGKHGRVRRDPRGVVALISPWNFPVALPLRTLIPALLAGNAVVFKPSEVSPRAGALVASLFEGLIPEGVLTLVQGDGSAGARLLESDVDLVVFTGSVATGKRVAVACAERLVPCALELGGKDAAIVLADCNVERAAHGIAWAAFTNAGQNCAAVERVYVEQPVAEAFIAKLVEVTGKLKADRDTAVITTRSQHALVSRQLDEALGAGAELLAGGSPEGDDLRFPPTVVRVDEGSADCALLTDETFGPVVPVQVVADESEAIARANDSRYALTTSIWTKRLHHASKLAGQLRSGVVTINNHAFTGALPAAPWTGVGESGHGITNSRHALDSLTRVRFVLEDRSRARDLWWYPYTPALRTIAFAMAALRGGAGLLGRIGALFRLLGALPKRMTGG